MELGKRRLPIGVSDKVVCEEEVDVLDECPHQHPPATEAGVARGGQPT